MTLKWQKVTLSICPDKTNKQTTVFCPNNNFTLKVLLEKDIRDAKLSRKEHFTLYLHAWRPLAGMNVEGKRHRY